MEKKTFEEIYNEITRDGGFYMGGQMMYFAKKAAEIYVDQEKKAYAEQAVKADRERIGADVDSWTYATSEGTVVCVKDKLMNLPIELP